jgi:hypothetical protein
MTESIHRNWLSISSPEAGERSAVTYCQLNSARHRGVDPEACLRQLIERLPSYGSDEASLRQLLPETWAAAQQDRFTGIPTAAEPTRHPKQNHPVNPQWAARTGTHEYVSGLLPQSAKPPHKYACWLLKIALLY